MPTLVPGAVMTHGGVGRLVASDSLQADCKSIWRFNLLTKCGPADAKQVGLAWTRYFSRWLAWAPDYSIVLVPGTWSDRL